MQIFKKSMLLLSVMLALTAASAQAGLADPGDKIEPEAQYILQVNGKQVPITLDKEVVSNVTGPSVHLKLSRLPYRLFYKSGVQLMYPVNFVFEADASQPNLLVWTLTGNSAILMLQRYPKVSLAHIKSAFMDGLIAQYGAKNVKTSPTTLAAQEHKITGTKLTVSIANQTLIQEVYTFATEKNSFVLVVQDMPNQGKPTTENTKLKTMLWQSLKW